MYRIGIDLGGTNIAAGLVNEEYVILQKTSVPTLAAERTGMEVVKAMADVCHRLVEMQGIAMSEVEAIGVASPGIADSETGEVKYICSLPISGLNVAELLKEMTGVFEVHLENDANAAAWGEAVAGAAKGTHSSIMVTLGTGVGGGIIVNRQILTGFNFAGAEVGHMVIEKQGVPCICGRRGCWEAYSSATALIRMTKEKMEECAKTGRQTTLPDWAAKQGKVSGRTAFDAMKAGDEAAREVVDMYISYLATGITNLINVFRPQVLSIGGGISGEGEGLLKPLLPLVLKECYGGDVVEETKIRIAELGNDAGIIGAAFLGI